MPPPAQFTKEAILNEAFEILRSEGIEAVSARAIAKRLGSSTQPVYSAYDSMDSLKADLVEMAKDFASSFLVTNDEGEEPFLSIGIQYLRLARGAGGIQASVHVRPRRDRPGQPFLAGGAYRADEI